MRLVVYKYVLYFIIIQLLFPNFIKAQEITNSFFYTSKNGLSNGFTYSLFKDNRGLLWAGTTNGVNIFNGKDWLPFNLKTASFGATTNDGLIAGIAEDDQNNIYFCNYGNALCAYNYKKQTVTYFNNNTCNLISNNNIFACIFFEGAIYFNAGDNLYQLKKGVVTQLPTINTDIGLILEFKIIGKNLYAISNNGYLLQLNTEANKFDLFEKLDKPGLVVSLGHLNNNYLIGCTDGIYKINNSIKTKLKVLLYNKDLSNEYFISVGNFKLFDYLFCKKYGVLKIKNWGTDNVVLVDTLVTKKNTLSYNYCMADNSTQTLLFGGESGVEIIDFSSKPFLRQNIGKDIFVRTVYPISKNKYLIGSFNGIYEFDITNKKLKNLSDSYAKTVCYNIFNYKNNVYINTSKGLIAYDNGKVKTDLPPALAFFKNTMLTNVEVKDSLFACSELNSSIFYVKNGEEKMRTLTVPQIIESFSILNNKIYYTDFNNLYSLPLSYPYTITNLNIKSNFIANFKNDNYAFSAENGLIKLNNNKQVLITKETATQGNVITTDKELFFLNSKGLHTYNINHNLYTESDGLGELDFTEYGMSKFKDEIYAGCSNGFVYRNANFKKSFTNPNNKIELLGTYYFENGKYNLAIKNRFSYKQNSLKFLLYTSNFNSPEKGNIFYKLNNSEWLPLGNTRTLDITQLSPGKYAINFKLDTLYNPGSKIASYNFIIAPPWWATWWFKFLMTLLGLSLVIGILYYYYQNLLKEKQAIINKLQAIQTERERISADIHDDLGSNISSINLLLNQIAKKNKDPLIISATYEAKELVEKIREIIWVNKVENDLLKRFVLYVRQYIAKQCTKHEMNFEFKSSENYDDLVIDGITRKEVFMCIKEAVNNSLKYAQASQISCEIILAKNQLVISISDNGKGISEANLFGNGLKQINARMLKIGGSAQILHKSGTTISLILLL